MPSSRPRVFSIIAGTLYGNRGAQAMTETVVGWIRDRDPEARFHVFSYYPEADRRLLLPHASHVTVHSATPRALVTRLFLQPLLFRAVPPLRRRAPADVRAVMESTALVDVAGVSFVDGRERFLPFNVLTLWAAWVLGVPIVKMSQAVGPFRGRLNRLAASLVLPRVRVLWARGQRTYEHVTSTRALRRVRAGRGDDIAFGHRDAFALTDEPGGPALAAHLAAIDEARESSGARAVVGLCPSSVVAVRSRATGGDYEEVLAGLVRSLAAEGLLVVLFPNASRAADTVRERNNDLPLIRRVLARAGAAVTVDGAPAPAPVAVLDDLSATSVRAVLARCDVAVVSRFHAMVGALSLAVPVVVTGWSHKYAEVMARFGLEDLVADHSGATVTALAATVRRVLDDPEAVRKAIQAALPGVMESAEQPLAGLLDDDLGVARAARTRS